MTLVWMGGRWCRAGAVERGALLVRSEREWRARAWHRVHAHTVVMSSVLVFGAVTFMSATMRSGTPSGGGPALVSAAYLLVAAGLVVVSAVVCGAGHMWAGRALPGVYERGVELPWGRFVPYGEVMRVERLGTRAALVLCPRGPIYPLDGGIYGREGVAHLEAVMALRAATGGVQGPPRLVVYGGER